MMGPCVCLDASFTWIEPSQLPRGGRFEIGNWAHLTLSSRLLFRLSLEMQQRRQLCVVVSWRRKGWWRRQLTSKESDSKFASTCARQPSPDRPATLRHHPARWIGVRTTRPSRWWGRCMHVKYKRCQRTTLNGSSTCLSYSSSRQWSMSSIPLRREKARGMWMTAGERRGDTGGKGRGARRYWPGGHSSGIHWRGRPPFMILAWPPLISPCLLWSGNRSLVQCARNRQVISPNPHPSHEILLVLAVNAQLLSDFPQYWYNST